jgi:phenylalanyl-tRNA synthetase alpha chain
MTQSGVATQLHPLETRVLLSLGQAELLSAATLEQRLGFNLGQCNQVFSWLGTKGLVAEQGRIKVTEFELTEIGKDFLARGTPEERIVDLLAREGGLPLPLPEIAKRLGLEQSDVGSAFGALSREGLLAMDSEKRATVADATRRASLDAQKALLARIGSARLAESALSTADRTLAGSLARKRGASRGVIRALEREDVTYGFTPQAEAVRAALRDAGVTGDEIGVLTPEILQSGEWRAKGFRAYTISVPPQRVLPGRQNPYAGFIRDLKDKLASLGFEEFDGPLVETEFWNGDALFMPQFHSARDIHDVYYVKEPTHAREIEEPYLSQVAAAHEDGWTTGSMGWRYGFDRAFTRRLILRSQGTVLSAKQLPKAKVPGKYFGCVRCFRYDRVDATHLADFYQTEGIVLGEEVNLRTLLGLLTMFAKEVAGAEDVRFVPGYFPFTEPSVEVHMRHPVIGWFELGGSGIFRPEVTRPLGIDVPVLAWGLGIDRMAMMSLGINDIRELFSPNLEAVRLRVRRQG